VYLLWQKEEPSQPTYASVKLASPASLNDCVMRNVYRYRYAVVIDFDEVIVPRFHDDYTQMVAHINRKFRLKDRPYTYTFLNTYFFLSFQQDTQQPSYMRSFRFRRRVPPTGVCRFILIGLVCCLWSVLPPLHASALSIHPFINTHKAAVIIKYKNTKVQWTEKYTKKK